MNKIVPKIRFKEFNNEYNNCKLKDIVDFYRGNTLSKADLKENGIKKCILYGELYTKYSEIAYEIFSRTNNSNKNLFLGKTNDVLIPCSGETALDISTSTCLQEDNVVIGGDLNVLRPKKDDGKYLSYLLCHKKRREIAKFAQGDSIVHLYGEKIKNINIHLPNMKEQIKVSDLLSLLDKKIELQQEKIENLKLYSESIKEKILSNSVKINCNAVWTNTTLKNILIKMNKKNKDNKITYVESINNKKGFIAQKEQFEDRNIASSNTSNYYVIEKNTFAYNPSRLDVGSLALKTNDNISIVSPLYECFTTTQNVIYMLNWFKSSLFKKETLSKFEGGVRHTLNFTNLGKINICIPDINTQSNIAKIFEILDFKVSIEEKCLEQLNLYKRHLLTNMFI